ncbi:MAG: hypothetical protein JW704_01320 [Anaerolineaceae bacterium]|nr:hypothetical protein [Anaerolineaceae bacterium]
MRRWIYGLAILVFVIVVIGCHDDCKPEATRCNGNMAQVCNTSKDWETMTGGDCDAVSKDTPFTFECQWDVDAEQHLCVPVGFPSSDGGDGGK